MSKWIVVEDQEVAEKIRKFLEFRMEEHDSSFSLHCWEEVYNLPGVTYRLSGPLGNEDAFILEYLE
jgi:hypothetical protein